MGGVLTLLVHPIVAYRLCLCDAGESASYSMIIVHLGSQASQAEQGCHAIM